MTTPMTPELLDEARLLFAAMRRWADIAEMVVVLPKDCDVFDALVAEIERLQAENAALRASQPSTEEPTP